MDKEIAKEIKFWFLMNLDVEHLDISMRTLNCLKYANIKTIYELVHKKEEELAKIPMLGPRTIKDIYRALELHGLSLNMQFDGWLITDTHKALNHLDNIIKSDL